MFSFGVVLWELVTLNIPWHEDDKKPPPEAAAGAGRAGGTKDPPEEPTYQDPTMFVVLNVPTGIRLELPKTIDPPLPELPMVSQSNSAGSFQMSSRALCPLALSSPCPDWFVVRKSSVPKQHNCTRLVSESPLVGGRYLDM